MFPCLLPTSGALHMQLLVEPPFPQLSLWPSPASLQGSAQRHPPPPSQRPSTACLMKSSTPVFYPITCFSYFITLRSIEYALTCYF